MKVENEQSGSLRETNETSVPLSDIYPRELLSLTERIAISIGRRINHPGLLRWFSVWWGRLFTCPVLKRVTGHRWRHHHSDRLQQISRQAPLLVVSNHRTFFDMYVGITALRYLTKYRLGAPSVFPVRAPFFYDRPLGVILNLIASGGCMWPPVFRDNRREQLNQVTTAEMKSLMNLDGVCFGFHPEGKRSKSDDPFTLLPPKRGVGVLLEESREDLVILPLFISGLSGDVKREWSLRGSDAAKTDPIEFFWGEPTSPSQFSGDAAEIASQVHQLIQELGDEARAQAHSE